MKTRSRLWLLPCGVTLIGLLLTSPQVLLAEGRWELAGPYGGSITALAVAPGAQRTLYAGSSEGLVFRSTDAGAHWSRVNGGFPGYTPVVDLDVDPRDPAAVYVSSCAVLVEFSMKIGGLFKTVDGGRTWTRLEGGLTECEVTELAIDPWAPSRLFAATEAGLFQSDDGGATWRANAGIPHAHSHDFAGHSWVWTTVAFDPHVPGAVYASHEEMGFLKSVDGGATWLPKGADLLAGGWGLFEIVPDPRTPGRLYGLASNGTASFLFRSTDGGETWSPAVAGLEGRALRDLAISPASSVLYLATDAGVFRSEDGGLIWTPPPPGTPVREALAVAAPRWPAATVYAGILHEGVFKSADGGRSWRSASRGLVAGPVSLLAVAPSDPAALYAVLTEQIQPTIARTLDGGATWQAAAMGGIPLALAVDPRDPRVAFAAGHGGLIWKTTDAGAVWRRVNGEETACASFTDLVIDPQDPDTLYAIGPRDSCPLRPDACAAFKSTDHGESWSCMEGLPREDLMALALAPSRSSVLYAGADGTAAPPVLKSADAGQTWRVRSGGLPRRQVHSLAVSPRDPRIVYASFSTEGLYRSVDGAASWTAVRQGLSAGFAGEVVFAPNRPSLLFVAVTPLHSPSRLFRSADAGASWTPLTLAGLPEDAVVRSLRILPGRPRTMYAATVFGIYRLVLGGR